MSSKSNIYFGSCSWKYDSWKGLVYPHFDKINYLEEYAKQYRSVEVDQWFWSLFAPGSPPALPKLKDIEEYNAATPRDFKFTIKAPNSVSLTHHYPRYTGGKMAENEYFLSPELWGKFIDSLGALKEKIGAVILQFEYLNKQKMPAQSIFLKKLEDFFTAIPRDVPVAVETRNPYYLNKEFFTFLHDQELIPVFLQGYYMPPVFPVIEKFRNLLPKSMIIRLHGPDRQGMEEKTNGVWNKIIAPKDEELQNLARLLGVLSEAGTEVYVNVNNHYEGSAPITIQKIETLMGAGA